MAENDEYEVFMPYPVNEHAEELEANGFGITLQEKFQQWLNVVSKDPGGEGEDVAVDEAPPPKPMKKVKKKPLLGKPQVKFVIQKPDGTMGKMHEGPPTWNSPNLQQLVDSLNKNHQSVIFVVCDPVFMSKSQERIQSLVGSLNRTPDFANGGTIKVDVYTVSASDGVYTARLGLMTDYESFTPEGTVPINELLAAARTRWSMAAFVA